MKAYIFPYYISFGKLDSVSSEIELSVSDKDAKRLERSAKEGGRFKLNEDDALSDLYDRVYKAIILSEKEALVSDPTPIQDALSWKEDFNEDLPISDAQIDYYLSELVIGINYPEKLQLLERIEGKKKKQTNCESILVDRGIAQDCVFTKKNNDKIVYTDDGDTLYYVPLKYSGTFEIPSSVKRMEGGSVFNPFKNRNKITEIIIEEGLEEIPDWAFEGCSELERITIPGSVKRIGFNAFTKCSRLKQVEMEEGVSEIDNTAFRFCYDLQELCIPASVETISMHITSYQAGIKSIRFEGMTTRIDDTRCREDAWDKITIYAKKGSAAECFAKDHVVKLELI